MYIEQFTAGPLDFDITRCSQYHTVIVQEENKYIKDFHFFKFISTNTSTDACAVTAMLCKTPGSIRIL